MVLEEFKPGAVPEIYKRLDERGRMMPDGLVYHSSWIDPAAGRCFQLMEADDPARFASWIDAWSDLMDFDVVPVVSSADMRRLVESGGWSAEDAPPRLTELIPMLRTWDLRGTVAFYTEVAGFECEAFDEESGWASLSRDDVVLMVSGPNDHEGDTEAAFTGSLYIRTSDIDALWEQLKERARVCYPIENFEYGMREFAIYDNNGYLLQFGQELSD